MRLLPKTANIFLRESSIHGFRYLVESRTPLVKILWLLSVVFSITMSTIIIYMNIVNWNSTPAVVTNMYPTLAKGKNFMPMITVCPRFTNPAKLYFELAKLYQTQAKVDQFKDFLEEDLAWVETANKALPFGTKIEEYEEAFNFCYIDDNANKDDKCLFLKLLTTIVTKVPVYEYMYNNVKTLDEYVLGKYVLHLTKNQIQPTLQHLKDFVEEKESITLNNYNETELPNPSSWSYRYDLEDMVTLYSFFFPVFDSDDNLLLMKGLDDYVLPKVPPWNVESGDYASLIYYMLDGLLLQDKTILKHRAELIKITADSLFEWSAKFLGTESTEETFHVMNSFSYDPTYSPFFMIMKEVLFKPDYEYSCFNIEGDNIEEICKSADEQGDSECLDYCVKIFNETIREKAIELFIMGQDGFGQLNPESPQSLLPVCRFPSKTNKGPLSRDFLNEGCWKKVVTEKGICFSSMTDNTKTSIVSIGSDSAFEFAMDLSGKFEVDPENKVKTLPQRQYDIMVTPPNHYAIGRLAEEEKTAFSYIDEYARDLVWILKVKLDYVSEGTSDFRALDPNSRDCYYDHEYSLPTFGVYSEPNCVLECAWQIALESCDCVPWFLLDFHPGSKMCEAYGNKCFREKVKGRYSKEMEENECIAKCLPDCETVQYIIADPLEESETAYNYENIYTSGTKTSANELYFDYVKHNKTNNAKPEITDIMKPFDRFEVILDNVGLIKVFIDKKSTLRIIQTATVTIIDMISNIGGTLALFSGFSILSGAEMLYWMARMVTKKNI